MTEHVVFLIIGGSLVWKFGVAFQWNYRQEPQNYINTATKYRAERKSLSNVWKEKLRVSKSSNKKRKIGNKVLSTKISSY